MSIVIIGAGEIGNAIAFVLKNKGLNLNLWDKDISRVPNQKLLEDILPNADFLFICTPSWAVRPALKNALAHLNKNAVVVVLSKGIEKDTNKTMDKVLDELLSESTGFALLSGPMIAEELTQEMFGIGVAASESREIFDKLSKLFADTNLRLEYSPDIRGTTLAGALKNIYAVGLGIIDALNTGGNFKGWFTQGAVKEMAEIIEILGGQKETVFGIAGLGDLVATGFSSYSRNRKVGDELVKTGKCSLTSEGIISMPSVVTLLGKKIEEFPLLNALSEICIQNKNAQTVFEKLINNPIYKNTDIRL